MSLLGDSGYSRVPVTLSQALGRGFLQGLDQHGQAEQAQLAAEARRVEQAEAEARRAEAQFKQDLMRERLGFEQNKFSHQQAKDRDAAAQRARLLGLLGPRGSAGPPGPSAPSGIAPPGPSAPPDHNPDLTGGTGSPGEPVPGPAGPGDPGGQQGFPLTPREAMALKAAGLPDFTDDVADHQRQQLAQQKFAYQQKKDDKDFHYKINEKRIDDLRSAHDQLRDAPERYHRLEEAEALLDQGIFSGSLFDRVVHSFNKNIPMDVQGLARTEAYVALMGHEVLAIIKGFGSGTAISDKDREYAQAIAGGELALNEASLKKIIGIAKKGIRNSLQHWNEDLPNRQRGLEAYFPESMNFEVPGQAEPAKPVDQWADEELLEYLGW
ncbi:MAG: collagen-like protein [Candidatus Thiodiazotropha endolucinida]|nr:collagen-like protein [Candidatus Thiodiazotropha endolucinida]